MKADVLHVQVIRIAHRAKMALDLIIMLIVNNVKQDAKFADQEQINALNVLMDIMEMRKVIIWLSAMLVQPKIARFVQIYQE